ncbi:T9SS type A sorting domain-containing protein [Ferruginibacter albus]|uniref:T9SS type A sorting domain-containing protein n=1 Tax=Ferruginibacter albus TaxID=2875540 RepID=UPI001CC501A5|nr:T9SS type A sorting domain-containing protein [Ferruginibacter albus]UAY52725.1 T9SS type A sorting domain-containing protein [Ferruginibacter albus]
MISLGADSAGNDITTGLQLRGITKAVTYANNFYNNSVYIGGGAAIGGVQNTAAFTRATAATASPNDSVVNNIFVNARSNNTATGKHYAATFYSGNGFLTLSNNLYYANGTGGVFGNDGTSDVTTYSDGWVGSDVNSVYGDPKFKTPVGDAGTIDLHILSGTSAAYSKGIVLAGVTDDIDGDARSLAGPSIGADEFSGIILPVTILSFNGQKQANSNLLYWSTAAEINNKGFEVQHSRDGIVFSDLHFITSKAQNNNSLFNYSDVDAHPFAGDNYYRLKQLNADNSISYSKTVLIKGDEIANKIIVYPNPASSLLNVVIVSQQNSTISIQINDMNGKRVLLSNAALRTGNNTIPLDVSHLAKGAYAIKVINADGSLVNRGSFIK